MGKADIGEKKGGDGRPADILNYLAYQPIPRDVAKRNLENGFRHGRVAPAFEGKIPTSVKQISKALGIANSNLYGGNLSPNIEFSIRKLYDIGEASWKHFCRRDRPAFIAAYERAHASRIHDPQNQSPLGAGASVAALHPPSDVLLVQGPRKRPEPSKERGLAAIQLFPAQIGRGTADIGFEISCGKAWMFGVPVTIRVGEVTLDCGGGELDPQTRKGRGVAYQPNNSTVKLKWNGADTFHPSWRVETKGASIGDLDIPPDFAAVIGLAPGSTITIEFGVWGPNIEEAYVGDTDAPIAQADAITILRDGTSGADPAGLSDLKKRILAKLATQQLASQGDYIVLCRHSVTFVASPIE